MLIMNTPTKKELLNLEIDKKIVTLLEKPELQKALVQQAKTVLKLLQESEFKTIEARQVEKIS